MDAGTPMRRLLTIIQARDETVEAWTRLAAVEVVKKSQTPNLKAEFADSLNMGYERRRSQGQHQGFES